VEKVLATGIETPELLHTYAEILTHRSDLEQARGVSGGLALRERALPRAAELYRLEAMEIRQGYVYRRCLLLAARAASGAGRPADALAFAEHVETVCRELIALEPDVPWHERELRRAETLQAEAAKQLSLAGAGG
jgi:hypothetical protein